MNFSQNVNPVSYPVNAKSVCINETLQNGATSTGNGTEIEIASSDCIVLHVTGTFVGTIYPKARIGAGDLAKVPVYYADTGGTVKDSYITKPGVYFVKNITGYSKFVARVESYTSGSITVTARRVSLATVMGNLPHVARIGEALGVEVTAGQTKIVVTERVCEDFAFYFVKLRCSTAHSHEVMCQFPESDSTLGAVNPSVIALSGNEQRESSEWLQIMGSKITTFIKNKDETNRTYDLFLYGVR